jgi:hypothetical protein
MTICATTSIMATLLALGRAELASTATTTDCTTGQARYERMDAPGFTAGFHPSQSTGAG